MPTDSHAVVRGSEHPIEGRCGGKIANSDPPRYCMEWPIAGGRRCKFHGARGGRPPTTGRDVAWERTLGPTWRVLKKTQVRDLEVNARVILAREAELRERLGDGDSTDFRNQAVKMMAEVRARARAGDGEGLTRAIAALERHLIEGRDREGVWREILDIEERHARMVETATKVETAAQNCMTGRALVGLLGTIFDLVMEEAGERVAYRVGRRFDRIIAADLPDGCALPALPGARAGGGEEPPEIPE